MRITLIISLGFSRASHAEMSTAAAVDSTVVSRMCVGSYIVDEEHVTGRPEGDLHAIAVYRLDGAGLIDRVRILR